MDNNGNFSSNRPGGNASVTYSAARSVSSDTAIVNETLSSTTGGQNAILFSGGTSGLEYITINKSGDDNSGDNADFYGTNAALLAHNGASVDFNNSSIETNGKHANALFSYGNGTIINAMNSKIRTYADNSGALMVTGGGKIIAVNLDVETTGNSSAPIRSDRGGGEINVYGGTYISNGVGSPAIYSTANISANETVLVSKASEGVVIEGGNSVSLYNSALNATNKTLNGNSETYKTIFIYQSQSGDASSGTGTFSASNSVITTNKGDHFFITNTNATVNLSSTQFIQNDANGIFMRAEGAKWGTSGSNGGHVVVNATHQEIIGNLYADSISSITLNLTSESYFKGALLGEGNKILHISTDSTFVLTEDTYVDEIEVVDSETGETVHSSSDDSSGDSSYTYTNIYGNGHNLYANSTQMSLNDGESPASTIVHSKQSQDLAVLGAQASGQNDGLPGWGVAAIAGGAVIVVAAIAIAIFLIAKRKKDKEQKKSHRS